MRFDPADGSKPVQSTVQTGTLAAPPQQNPKREGFRFDGWTHDSQPFDFQIPILQDTTLKAQWTKTTDWMLSPDHGPASGARLTINPPDRQEPYYTSIHSEGDQFVSLTGDGRIYTWTPDSTPKQVPDPVQAPDGFHYLQTASGSGRQAALGSDQHIYTWGSGQATPKILNSNQNAKFKSISMNDNQLLSVDRQGKIHAFLSNQIEGRYPDSKLAEQETISLPGQAQAVLATASANRILVVDADGQAWTWDTTNTGNVKPARIKQNLGIRIIQVQALKQGFLLLNADGQAYYMADSTASITAVSLPKGMKASKITSNNSQAMIVDKDGRVWVWNPGATPTRADNGNELYMQASVARNRITALNRQGSLQGWNLNEQHQPSKPTRLDTTQAPTLESAGMDGQQLILSKKNGTWQTKVPSHRPGPVSIVITGRQDDQPFNKSLTYMVDQTLTRGTKTETTYMVSFATNGGRPKPVDQNVSYPYRRVQRPSPDPIREGYQFDGWFIDKVAYDFNKPVTKGLILTAHWTRKSQNNTWSINPDKGSQLGQQQTTITPPDSVNGTKFSQISGSKDYNYGFSLAIGDDGNAYAWGYNNDGELGDGTTTNRSTPVIVRKPDHKTYKDLPEDFTYVQVSAGGQHSLALGSDGYVYAWGYNDAGQLGNDSSDSQSYSSVPVRVRDPSHPSDAKKGLKATQVSAGWKHSLALSSDGYAYAWGYNNYGQLGNGTSNYDTNFVPVRVRDPSNPTDVNKGLKATQVSAGYWHSLAIGSDGYAYAWGLNDNGRLGNGTTQSSSVPVLVRDPGNPSDVGKGLKATQVSAGGTHSLALDTDGYAYAWGRNDYGELGNNSTTDWSIPVLVRDPGNPSDMSKGLKATQVSAGYWHSLAIGSDGYAYAWGLNDNGQLGNNGMSKTYSYPVRVFASEQSTSSGGPWLKAMQVSSGGYHSLTIDTDGNTKAWGYNDSGRLGDGNTDNSKAPVPVVLNLQPTITGVKFGTSPGMNLKSGDGNSVTVITPAHQPGMVTVSVDYTLGSAPQTPDTSLQYTYLPAGVLPKAGGEGILLALATGLTGMGGVLASRRHHRETHQLLHTSHE